jgi:hypothetical protein
LSNLKAIERRRLPELARSGETPGTSDWEPEDADMPLSAANAVEKMPQLSFGGCVPAAAQNLFRRVQVISVFDAQVFWTRLMSEYGLVVPPMITSRLDG